MLIIRLELLWRPERWPHKSGNVEVTSHMHLFEVGLVIEG